MKKLLILSGKGGTGKTTIAGAFIKLGHAEAFADCDVDAPNLHLVMDCKTEPAIKDYFGMGKAKIDSVKCLSCGLCQKNCRFNAVTKTEHHYIINIFSCEGCGVCEAVCPAGAVQLVPDIAGRLELYKDATVFSTAELKMGSGTSGKLVTEVKRQLNCVEDIVELAIIDGSPGIGCPVIASINGVDLVLVVAEPSLSGISDMKRIIKTVQNFHVKMLVCINKYDTNLQCTEKIESLCNEEGLPVAGRIPFDFSIIKALNKGESVIHTNCAGAKAIQGVYEKTMKILKNQINE